MTPELSLWIFARGPFFGEVKYRLWANLAAATAGLRNDPRVSGPRAEPTVVTAVNIVNVPVLVQSKPRAVFPPNAKPARKPATDAAGPTGLPKLEVHHSTS